MPDVRHVVLVAQDVKAVGGMERQLTELIQGLLRRGWRVTVVSRTLHLQPGPNLRWLRVRGPARPFTVAYPWFFIAAALQLRRAKPGVLHTTGAIVLRRTDLSTVHFCHAAVRNRAPLARVSRASLPYLLNAALVARMSRWAERWGYRPRQARLLVGVSEGVSRELEELLPSTRGRVRTVQNGVDPDVFRPPRTAGEHSHDVIGPPDGRLVALFVGGEWERKGLRLAIEAVGQSQRWRLVVVGSGDVERYERIASTLGAGDRVRFHPPLVDIAAVYRVADAFVLPTAYETFSLVTYEAAASGLPLLVTRVSGVEELLVDGGNGWFIPRDAAEIAKRLDALANEPMLRKRFGQAAREASLRFSWEAMVDAYISLYDELDSPSRAPRRATSEGPDHAEPTATGLNARS